MTQAGGSATMYGVLYQLLGTAHWAASVELDVSIDGDAWSEARIVIEPSGGGGDIRIESPKRRIVEQWKAKSDAGAWPLKKVISDVLPDLYRDVDLDSERPETEFRFVTEGHRGKWKPAEQFFVELSGNDVLEDPYAAMDDKESFKFLPDGEFTKLAFFRHILDSLKTHRDIANDSDIEIAKKLRYLLGHLNFRWDQTAEKLIRELDGFLRPLVDYIEDVERKRRELCAALLELAAQGNATFKPQKLLAKVDLDHISFRERLQSRGAMLEATKRTVRRRWQYDPNLDVRPEMHVDTNSFVVVVSGESGQGKTWRLASQALNAFTSGSLAVAVSATGAADRDMQEAAQIVWRAYGRESATNIHLVAKKRCEFFPQLPTPWLTICVDDVQSMAEARSLIDYDLSTLGIRLAITTLPHVAQALKTQYRQKIAIIDVDDFSVLELRRYLENNGRDWAMLPADVRTILRRPLLAKLYCDVAEEENWCPTNEYALFARYWQRIRVHRDQTNYPGDVEAMRQLASTFLDESTVYPWSPSVCKKSGVSSDIQIRLEAIGWLRRSGDDSVEVMHDRLLNWAVAEALVAKRVSGEWSSDKLAEQVSAFYGREAEKSSGRRLGYVAMDVCWMMGEPSTNLVDELPGVIMAIDSKTSISHSEDLYKNLLPTLGPRVIGPMVERIRIAVGVDEEVESGPWPFARFLSDAVVQIGRQHPNDVAEWGRSMIEDECATIRRAGLRILRHFPNVAALNELWELHKVNYDVVVRKEGDRWWAGHERSFAALTSCTRLNPEWLERRILESEDGSEPFTELAFLVANLKGSSGKELWHRVKSALFSKVPSDKPRCLVRCVLQHSDRTEIPRLELWLSQEGDLTREYAFHALVYFDPKEAISSLRRLPTAALRATKKWWRPGLLLRFPNETRNQIRELMDKSAEARWHGANIYKDDPNQMDEATLDLLLDELETLVEHALDPSKKEELYGPLSLLADVTRLDLLWRFEERAGTPLERLLTDFACGRLERMTLYVDHEHECAVDVLVKISGEGLTKLVNKQLASENKHARGKGIRLSLIRPDSETRRLLADITQTSGFWDEEQCLPLLQADATVALAAQGENRAVVDSILRWGVVWSDLPGMREGQPPMTDGDLVGAIEALGSSDTNTATNAVLALSVSGRADFAPQIRQILKDADPESELARVTVVALDHFGDTHPEALKLLEAQLAIPNHAHAASLALLRNGKRESLAVLEREFRRRGSTRGKAANDFLAVSLAMRQESRKTVAEVLWKRIQEHRELYGVIPGLDCLAEIDSPQVREFLVEEAHAAEGVLGNNGRKVAAIHALAKVDRDSAFRAAEVALRRDQRDLELYPDALMEIDEARAISILFDIYSLDQPTLARWAIGRALRRASDQAMIHSTLGEMLQAESTDTCIIGLEISAWQPPSLADNQIRQIAITNPVSEVRRAAEQTVGSIERQGFALKLIEEIGKTHGARCWSYLEAVVSLSDPWLLTTRSDPLYLWGPLSRKPPGLGNRALELIKRRQEKLKSEAEKADRDRNR